KRCIGGAARPGQQKGRRKSSAALRAHDGSRLAGRAAPAPKKVRRQYRCAAVPHDPCYIHLANKAVARPTLAETFRKVPNAGNFSVARIAWVVEKEMARPKGFEPLIPRFRGRAERYLSL